MKTHTSQFKNELSNMGRQIDSIITYGNITLHEELYAVTPHFEANLLKSVMKQLDFESSVSVPVGTELNCKIGVKVGNAFEYLDYGNYIVYGVEKIEDADSYKIICYDKMLYSMKEYESLGVTYPITVTNFISVLCSKIGLTFKDAGTQFANYNKQIPEELYLDSEGNSMGYTYRDVLDELAQVTASIICIDPSTDKLQIKYPTQTNDTIDENFLKDVNVKFGQKYGPVNTIVLSRSAGADNIYYPSTLPSNIHAIKIADNQIMNWNDRDTYMPDIYNKLNGLEYYINDFSSTGILYYELGDFYNITVGSTSYKCLMLNDEINVTQGIEEIIHTDMLEEAETDYEKADKTDRKINQAFLIVDKKNQEITARVDTIENVSIPNLQDQIDGAIQFWNGSAIPTLSNYPASDWTTEADRNNHRADIYTVIQDVSGELKQGKSYRFDKVGNVWQWVELTDNELSAVQALASSKAKVFVTTPTVPYSVGDLWLKDGKLYRCKTAKDSSGSYSVSDWELAVDYTDDTVAEIARGLANTAQTTASNAQTAANNAQTSANNAQTAANNAQSTADSALEGVNNITNTTGKAEGKIIHIEDSANEPIISAKFNGETSQETRSGKNIFNKNSILTISSGASRATLNTGVRITQTESGNYKYFATTIGGSELLGKTLTINSTIIPSSNNIGAYVLFFGSSGTPAVSRIGNIISSSGKQTVNIPSSFPTNTDRIYILLYANLNGTGNANDYVDYTNLQVEIGSQATSYEDFGAMPSPDYPSEIKNLEGKNIAYTGWAENFVTRINDETKAKIETYDNRNCLYYLAMAGYQEYNTKYMFKTNWKENTQYTISFDILNSANFSNLAIEYTDGTTSLFSSYTANIWGHLTLTTLANKTVKYIRVNWSSGFCYIDLDTFQVEEGTVATPYAPYNSLEVKVGNKNIAALKDGTYTNRGVTAVVSNGAITLSGTSNDSSTSSLIDIPLAKPISTNVGTLTKSLSPSGTYTEVQTSLRASNPNTSVGLWSNNGANQSGTLSGDAYYFRIQIVYNKTVNCILKPQIEKGSTPSDYETHQEQTVYFPLEQGQKLYKGSYLADDGIHNVRGQVVLDGTESWSNQNGEYDTTDRIFFGAKINSINADLANRKGKCNYFVNSNTSVQSSIDITAFSFHPQAQYSNYIYFKIEKSALTSQNYNGWKAWLQEHLPVVEYELAEEEIIPYNTEQQEAWNKIKELMTYKNITNIYSDAYAEIEYVKDNGLDIYETKASANLTKNEVSQLKIEQGRIATEVSSTQSSLNNYYTKNEADNNTNTAKAELQNIIQQNKTEIEQTTRDISLRVTDIETNGVDKIETSMGYTFNNEGLNIDKEGAATASTIDNEAFKVKNKSANENVFFAGYVSDQDSAYRGQTIVESTNLVVKNYLNIEGASRFQPYVNPTLGGHGTGAFDIG